MSSRVKPGRFIVLDGGEGVGKTTNLGFIASYLESQSIPFSQSREPGGTPFAEEIRGLLLKTRAESVEPITELLMIFAARCQHLNQLIKPRLAAGEWILCDRFTDATFAYQGFGRDLPIDVITTLETMVQGALRPDRVIVLESPLSVTNQRLKKRSSLDRMEREPDEFHKRVKEGFRVRAEASPETHRLIDSSQPLKTVQQHIQLLLDELIDEWKADD